VPPVPVPPPYALHPSPYALRFPEDRRTGGPEYRMTGRPTPDPRSPFRASRLALRVPRLAFRDAMPSLRRRIEQRPLKPAIKIAIFEEFFHPANGNKSACPVSRVSYVRFGELPSPAIHGLKARATCARATSLCPLPYALRPQVSGGPEDRNTG